MKLKVSVACNIILLIIVVVMGVTAYNGRSDEPVETIDDAAENHLENDFARLLREEVLNSAQDAAENHLENDFARLFREEVLNSAQNAADSHSENDFAPPQSKRKLPVLNDPVMEQQEEQPSSPIPGEIVWRMRNYECMQNPVDQLFMEALSGAGSEVNYRSCQELYYDTWKAQYEEIMEVLYEKCKSEEAIADYEMFVKEMEEGFGRLQPLIEMEMLDNYDIPEGAEKNTWGNGTLARLLMYEGAMYRNACMFFIPFLDADEYQFPQETVLESLSWFLY